MEHASPATNAGLLLIWPAFPVILQNQLVVCFWSWWELLS